MSDRIEYAYTSNIGRRRGSNEDNFWIGGESLPMLNKGTEGVLEGTFSDDSLFFAGLFDGMGGERCGEAASYLAAEEFGRFCREQEASFAKDPVKFIQNLCRSMNNKVLEYAEKEHIGSMGSTAAMVFASGRNLYAANLGDSRIFQFSGRGLSQVSEDHVLSGGFLGKAPLTQFLGLSEEEGFLLEPSVRKLKAGAGEWVLICSDGLTDMVAEEKIASRIEEGSEAKGIVRLLLEDALENGGRDNITILLLKISGAGGVLSRIGRFFGLK